MKDSRDPRRTDYKEIIAKFRQSIPDSLEVSTTSGSSTHGVSSTVESGLEEYNGAWNSVHIGFFLKRIFFGLKKSELTLFEGLSLSDAVDQIMDISEEFPAPPVNDYNAPGLTDPDIPYGDTWVDAAFSNDVALHRVVSLKSWMVKSIVNQKPTIEEKMVMFWHGLLVTEAWGVYVPKMSYVYSTMLRRNCLGNFKTLIKELTIDPAMLLYLNGAFNTKAAADENYGRELQELFCVGKGPNSGYTEGDVQTAARVLTGWDINWDEMEQVGPVGSSFTADRHDVGDKQFSAFYNNKLIAGKSGSDGAQELDELIEMIFDANETAAYLCRRIYGYFVNSEIDEVTEVNVIQPLAEILRANNYEVRPVMETLLKSAHFHDFLEEGALVKSPAEFLFGIWRSMEMEYPEPNDVAVRKLVHSNLHWGLIPQGMEIADPPGVAGWTPYYQAPLYDRGWITAGTIVVRARLTDNWLFNGFQLSTDVNVQIDLIKFVGNLSQQLDPNVLIKEMTELLLGSIIDDTRQLKLKSILLGGQETDSYWTEAWLDYQNDPNEVNKSIVENRLKPAFQSVFQMAEFQLM